MEDAPKQKPPSMSEIFERLCPYYMSYGMTYDQYWYGDPWALKAYRDAKHLRDRHENEMMWLNGFYTLNALSVVIGNAFAKKGSAPRKYLDKALDVFPKTEAEEAAEQEQKQKALIMGLSAWKTQFDAAKNR